MQDCAAQKNLFPTLVFTLVGIIAAGILLGIHHNATSNHDELDWLKQLARDGDAEAQLQLGLANSEGRYGLESDPQAGLYWLTAAAKSGNAYAADLVANTYADEENKQQALHWWRLAALHGNADAERHLGMQLLADGKDANGITWLRRAADRGDHAAHTLLTQLYGSDGVDDADLYRGTNSLDALGERLHTPGLRSLFAVWQIYKESSPYMHSADALLAKAKAGDPQAEYDLALRYRDGSWAVTQDQQASALWLQRSAADGNHFAMKTLASLHSDGQ